MIATTLIPPLSQADKDKFWKLASRPSGSDDCWLWTGLLSQQGYGRFHIGQRPFIAHRISFVLSGGEFHNGSLVLHKCRNKNCVNPAHLYSGTQKQNCADKERDGTVARGDRNGIRKHPELVTGEANGNAKLNEDAVRAMRLVRSATSLSYVRLARMFGVTPTHAQYICERKNWKHVK